MHLKRLILPALLGIVLVVGTSLPAGAAPVAPVNRLTSTVTGSVTAAGTDGFCPQDAFFPVEEAHDHYTGSGSGILGPFKLTVDTCIESDDGALGGNTFTATYKLTTLFGLVNFHGSSAGSQANEANEAFHVTLGSGRTPLFFQGCFPYGGGSLLNATLSFSSSVPTPACAQSS